MLYIISVTNNKSCGQITLKYEAFAMFQFVLKILHMINTHNNNLAILNPSNG